MVRASAALYDDLVAVMTQYMSRTSVKSTLRVVLLRIGTSAEELQAKDAERVVSESMVGLRLFCDPNRLPQLMLDLADYCDRVAPRDGDRPSSSAETESSGRP